MSQVHHVTIQRDPYEAGFATTGVLTIAEVPEFTLHVSDGKGGTKVVRQRGLMTIEDPNNNNESFKSCIPAGKYKLVPVQTPKHGKTWFMVNPDLGVYAYESDIPKGKKGRFACICAHTANKDEHIEGCVGIGMTKAKRSWDETEKRMEPMIFTSKPCVAAYHAVLPWEPGLIHELEIKEAA